MSATARMSRSVGGRSRLQSKAYTMPWGSGRCDDWEIPGRGAWWEDLSQMDHLDAESLLAELDRQYTGRRYASWFGDVLCVINPCGEVPGSTAHSIQARYRGTSDQRTLWPPHVFALADVAHQELIRSQENQVIVIRGETGSGKTVAANQLITMLHCCSTTPVAPDLKSKVLGSATVLEALGNARTETNPNSSRHARLANLRFSSEGTLLGAVQTVHLLERTRVHPQVDFGEHPFHIFKLMVEWADAHPAVKERLDLPPPEHLYPKVEAAETKVAGGVSSQGHVSLKQLTLAFDRIGLTNDAVLNLFRALGAVAKLTMLSFASDESATYCKERKLLATLSKALGVNALALECALTVRNVEIAGISCRKPYTEAEAQSFTLVLAQECYKKLFESVMNVCNGRTEGAEAQETDRSIGIVDVFGIEDRRKSDNPNSIEQLYTNTMNERLQHFFVEHTVDKVELQTAPADTALISALVQSSRRLCLTSALMSCLRDDLKRLGDSDNVFLQRFRDSVKDAYDETTCSFPSDESFIVRHFAGPVLYSIAGFREKNRNCLLLSVVGLLKDSSNGVVARAFGADNESQQAPSLQRKSISQRMSGTARKSRLLVFNQRRASSAQSRISDTKEESRGGRRMSKLPKNSAASSGFGQEFAESYLVDEVTNATSWLTQLLADSQPHFLFCIRPNSAGTVKGKLDWSLCENQLSVSGLLEAMQLQRSGYDVCLPITDFLAKFGQFFGTPHTLTTSTPAAECATILEKSGITHGIISGDEVRLTHWQHDRLQKVARVSLDFVGDNREKDAESTCSPKTWAQAILQISNRFVSSTEAAKCEDGDARLALWERRENRRRTRHSVCPVSRLSKASPRRSALTLVDDSRAFEKPSHDVIVHFFRTSGRAQHAGMRDDGEFCEWFHGILTRNEADERLQEQQDGTFLVRLSESRLGYTVSLMWHGRVKHFAVTVDSEGKHRIRGNVSGYRYLNDMIQVHQSKSITDRGDRLLYPCPGADKIALAELARVDTD